MGNWRTVQIVGRCAPEDVWALKKEITWDIHGDVPFYSLSYTGGVAGLPMWAGEVINAIGNCAERDYSVEDIARDLEELAKVASSLEVKVHCGGDYESKDVVATITLKDGKAVIGEPEIATLPDIPASQMLANFWSQMMR